jgi:predicted ATPase/class 3 adenylate cyclase
MEVMITEPLSGMLTFLFTDIEGSTRLWETEPAAMAVALARHDLIIQDAVETHHGHIFRMAGDAYAAAFSAAPDALLGAAMAQRALHAENWPLDPPLRVRMALHSAEAHWQGLEYRSPGLNRLARLLGAAHGGQTLVSRATRDLAGDRLPDGTALRDLGEHRLPDLSQAEHVFQLLIEGLPDDFRRIKSLDLIPNNLPSLPTSFIGRTHEMVQIRQELENTRLLTLTGTGGVGKTRLALQVGASVVDAYMDGVWFVELAPVADPGLIPQAVAAIWNLREQTERPLADSLADHLRARQTLLILDNCEHVIDGAAQLAERWLRAAPGLRIIATSREVLNIGGEKVHRVLPLGLPEPGIVLAPHDLTMFEGVHLFTERAAAVQPSFRLTEANAPLVAAICQRLDGIPLAIELAAALTRAMSLGEISNRLEDRFRLLTAGSRTAVPRQRTLQAAIDYSYNLLTASESILFRRLSVFRGGWTYEDAEAVCRGEGLEPGDILDLLVRLVDKSLVISEERGGAFWYTFLDTLRDYSRSRLRERGEDRSAGRQHLAYFAGFARDAIARTHGSDQVQWLARIEQEHDNLRAALTFAEQSGEAALQLQLSGSMWWFWRRRAHFSEGLNRLERAAGLKNAAAYPALLAEVLIGLGSFRWMRGEFAAARQALEQAVTLARTGAADARGILSLALRFLGATLMRLGDRDPAYNALAESAKIYRELDDASGLGGTLFTMSRLAIEGGDFDAAWALAQESCDASRMAGDDFGLGMALTNMGLIALQRRDYATARSAYLENLSAMQRINDPWGAAVAMVGLAELAQMEMDLESAGFYYEQSMNISRQLGNTGDIARCLRGRGMVARYRGAVAEAGRYLRESLELYQLTGSSRGVAECLESFGALAAAGGRLSQAVRLLAAGDALLASQNAVRWPANVFDFELTMSAARAGLDQAAFDEAWSAGRTLPTEQSITCALELAGAEEEPAN